MHTPIKYALLLIILFLLSLSACATRTTNYTPANLPPDSLKIIADDIAPIIAENNPAKKNNFVLHTDHFSRDLSKRLRKLGYAVSVSHQPGLAHNKAEMIRYTIDWLSPESLYIALSINNSERYTRTYTVAGDTLTPNNIQLVGMNDGRK